MSRVARVLPRAAVGVDDVAARLVPDLLGVHEHAVEIEDHRVAHAARDSAASAGAALLARAASSTARIAGEDSAPARQATNTWRLRRVAGQRDDHDARGRRGVREPRHERDPEPAGDEPHHRLPVARAVRDLRAEARRRGSRRRTPRRTTSRPAARPSSSSAQLGEVDPRAARQRVVGRQDGVEDVAQQLLAVEARVVAARRGASTPCRGSRPRRGRRASPPPRRSRPPGCAA